jgi:hypothetical protein
MTPPAEIFVHTGKNREVVERFRICRVETSYGWERCVKGVRWEQCDRILSGAMDALTRSRARIAELEGRTTPNEDGR